MGDAPQERLNERAFDPRSLFPTPENITIVTQYLERVQLQLDQDRSRLKQNPDNQLAKQYRNETLVYMSLLNDWMQDATRALNSRRNIRPGVPLSTAVQMDQAEEGEFPVLALPQSQPQRYPCLVDISRGMHYVFIKKLRDTIYGAVRLYQIGRMENGVVKFSMPAEQVAVKYYDKELVRKRRSRDGHAVQEDPLKELAIQQRLSHPGHRYVMPLLACLETAGKFFAVYPFVGGGELFEFVSNSAPLPEATAKTLMRGMLDGVHYCHQAGICHRDISLENFLLGGEHAREPLLIDFGLSVIMEPLGDQWKQIPHTGAVGKQFYVSLVAPFHEFTFH